MSKHAPKIRELLLSSPEGLTVPELAELCGLKEDTIVRALKLSYGFYIGAWALEGRLYKSQWRCVKVPQDAPRLYKTATNSENSIDHQNDRLDRSIKNAKHRYDAKRVLKRIEDQQSAVDKRLEKARLRAVLGAWSS